MLLSEIVNLSFWMAEKEKNFQPIAKLQSLKQILDANSQARNQNNRNQPALQPFTEQKEAAIQAIRQYRLSELSKDQIVCLSIYDADSHMGDTAAERLNEVFRDATHDMAFLAQKVTETHQALNNAQSNITKASEVVTPYALAVTEADYLDSKARFSIIFKDGVKVENLDDLEARSKEWGVIMHGIGVALDVAPNEFRVLGARNGSFVIDLFMCAAAIIPIGFILNRSLDIIERFAISLKRIESIYELDLDDPAFQKLEEQIKATNEEYFNLKKLVSAKKIAKDILDERECPEARRAEAETFLESSIKKILNHLRKGGDLDAFVPGGEDVHSEDAANEEEAANLIKDFRHKKLELSQQDIMALLEHFDFDDETEE